MSIPKQNLCGDTLNNLLFIISSYICSKNVSFFTKYNCHIKQREWGTTHCYQISHEGVWKIATCYHLNPIVSKHVGRVPLLGSKLIVLGLQNLCCRNYCCRIWVTKLSLLLLWGSPATNRWEPLIKKVPYSGKYLWQRVKVWGSWCVTLHCAKKALFAFRQLS